MAGPAYLYCRNFPAGTRLSIKIGDEIAALTGLGRSWIGLILLATTTSLPELISGVSAVTINKFPDMAVGGIIDNCLFNLVIPAELDIAAGKMPLSQKFITATSFPPASGSYC